MDDEEMMGDQSPKRSVGSARSSATLSPATPQDSPHDSSSDLIDVSTVSNLLDGHEPELPPQFEMKERDGGTMRAFAMDTRVPDTDDDMPDIEHVEQSPIGWQQRGG